jgi:tetratricopeptide (TPR) repeat protein
MVFAESLGMAYSKAGELENAQKEYERITQMMIGRLEHGDIYSRSFCALGKIAEQQGDTAKAVEHYERFLTLWKNADAGIVEVEDAKKRLAGLKGS